MGSNPSLTRDSQVYGNIYHHDTLIAGCPAMSFSDSPYQPPRTVDPRPPLSEPARKLKGPAIALLICGPLGILLLIVDLVARIINVNTGNIPVWGNAPGAAEGALIGVYVGMVFDVIAAICQVVVIIGAVSMLKARTYGTAMAAAVISVVPCLSSCCIVGIPFGIWALVVLNDTSVKAAFHEKG